MSPEKGRSSQGRAEDVWCRNVGRGYTSAAISDGRLYTIGYDIEAEMDTIYCLDAISGMEIWTQSYAAQIYDQDHTGGTLTSPVVDGERVSSANDDAPAT